LFPPWPLFALIAYERDVWLATNTRRLGLGTKASNQDSLAIRDAEEVGVFPFGSCQRGNGAHPPARDVSTAKRDVQAVGQIRLHDDDAV